MGTTRGDHRGIERHAGTRDRVVDVALAVAVIAIGLTRDLSRHGAVGRPPGLPLPYLVELPVAGLVTVHLLGGVLLLLRRRHPYPVAGALALLAVVTPVMAAMVMPYSVARYGGPIRTVLAANAALAAGVLTGADLWSALPRLDTASGDPYSPLLVVTALTFLGLYLRARADLIAELRDRAVQAAEQARLRGERRRLHERAELAVHLHDVVTRWVTLMTLQAGALSVRSDDQAVRSEAEELRAKGERAMHELHRLIQVLTADDEPVATAGATGQHIPLQEFVDLHYTAGPRTATETGDARWTRPDVHAVLREVASEALVNAAKHTPGAVVDVRLDHGERTATLRVTSGPPDHAGPSMSGTDAPGTGLGLAMMRRRCADLGGTLHTSRLEPAGFEVIAEVPARPARHGPPPAEGQS